jgi:hypothetical protein
METSVLKECAKAKTVYSQNTINIMSSYYPFDFKRFHFPLKLCFAMIINKAQGQSLKGVLALI